MSMDMGNLGNLMAGIQQRMVAARESASAAEVEGRAGGDLVVVRATGDQRIVSVRLAAGAHEDPELLEDLILAATNDALRRSRELMAEKLKEATGGLPLPPGLGL